LRSSTRARKPLSRAIESDVERLGEILPPSEELQLAPADDRPQRLLANFGKDQRRAVVAAFLRQPLERVDAGGVDRRNVLHAQDENLWRLRDFGNDLLEFRRGAEEERTIHGVDFHAVGDLVAADVLLAPPHLRDLARIL